MAEDPRSICGGGSCKTERVFVPRLGMDDQ